NVTCDAGQVCDNGNCIWEICVGTVCDAEEQCGPNGCEPVGACGDSVCVENEICFNNACVDPDNPGGSTSNGTSGTTPGDTTPDGGDTAGGGSGSDDGCGCHTVSRPTPTLPMSLLFAVGALAGIWMRRRP
ncbi:MAG: MYXO-CTERM sorting domain-containing protein, partial [Myxococcota bacterium]